LNVGSGGGAAAAPAAGGAAAGGAAEAAPAEEEKEEGMFPQSSFPASLDGATNTVYREGGVRRGHGLRSLRLNDLSSPFSSPFCHCRGFIKRISGQFHMHISILGVRLITMTQ